MAVWVQVTSYNTDDMGIIPKPCVGKKEQTPIGPLIFRTCMYNVDSQLIKQSYFKRYFRYWMGPKMAYILISMLYLKIIKYINTEHGQNPGTFKQIGVLTMLPCCKRVTLSH